MKKKIILIISIILIMVPFFYFGYKKYEEYKEEQRIKNAKIVVDLVDDLKFTYESKIKISDLIKNINGEIIGDTYLDTASIGKKTVNFKYINEENITIPYSITYEVVDDVAPIIWLNDSYSVKVGSKGELKDMIMSGDYYDDKPTREIIGDYNLNKIGNYNLTYRIVDKSGNETKKDFVLKVHNNPSNYKVNKKSFTDIRNKYRTSDTFVGIDISKWQGTIDYQKTIDAGIDFVMIKLGGTNGINGDYYLDPKFIDNIKGYQESNIPIGVYFYSYANSLEKAKEDALWVINQIKDYNITLPIALDWENWSSFNKFGISFKTLSEIGDTFIKTLEKNGYHGMIYGSKNYLENFWDVKDHNVWLAHYTDKTDYNGEYIMWQMTSGGVIKGITENTVDVNILYTNK